MRQDYIHVSAEDEEDMEDPPRRGPRRRAPREPAGELPFETEGDEPEKRSGGTKLPFDPMRLSLIHI